MHIELTLLYFDDCPNWHQDDEHLRALADHPGQRGLSVRRPRDVVANA